MSEQQENQQQFGVQRVYIKDVSFESPNSPAAFKAEWKPQVKVDLNTATQDLGGDAYEVVLQVTVTAKVGEEVAFLVEVHQAGIVTIKGFEDAQKAHMLGSYVPNLLFPYAREVVDNLVVKGTFPPVGLAPVNFDALFQQAVARRQAEMAEQETH